MSRRDDDLAADFAAYVASRRPALVRATALLGVPVGHAALLVDAVLDRARRDWANVRDDRDPDDALWSQIRLLHSHDETPWWEREPAASHPTLDVLGPSERAALVWETLAPTAMPDPSPSHRAVLDAAGAMPVPEPAPGRPSLAVAPPARRRTLRGLAALLAGLVVVGGVSWWVSRPGAVAPEPPLTHVEVRRQSDDVGIVWYAAERLHLLGGVADVPDLVAAVGMGRGAVYVDTLDRVVHIDARGRRTLLGRTDAAVGLRASPTFGWVAFATPDEVLEVVDVSSGAIVGEQQLAVTSRAEVNDGGRGGDGPAVSIVRFSGALLAYVDADGNHVWDLEAGQVSGSGLESGPLLDQVANSAVYQVAPDRLLIEQNYTASLTAPGVGAELSPRAQFVLTRVPNGGPNGPVSVLRAGEGGQAELGRLPAEGVLDARFTGAVEVTLLVGDPDDPTDATPGAVSVVRCQIGLRSCGPVTSVLGPDSAAFLAR
ncbi:hypothetical protein [Nocardioides acrostichi]|uniref:Uncharacterized protein n=1 Tax=Nocardioides acrostichi TaxID=2784339 RepID=A0A930UYY4_9ACTN|nr:hypothetical protein [Nocardioides acrostichi]MBF4162297.1 hypothetical protein [Nocardioides acrostichi]